MGRYNKIFAGPTTVTAPQVREAVMVAAIKPGTGVILDGAGKFAKVSVAGSRGDWTLLAENFLHHDSADTDVALGDTGVGFFPDSGVWLHMLVATANNVAIGSALAFTANGVLALATIGQEIVAFGAENHNNTSGSDQLVLVRPGIGEAD